MSILQKSTTANTWSSEKKGTEEQEDGASSGLIRFPQVDSCNDEHDKQADSTFERLRVTMDHSDNFETPQQQQMHSLHSQQLPDHDIDK